MTTRTLVINPPFLEPHRPPISCAIIGEVARLQGHEVVAVDLNINLFNKVKHEKFMELQNKYLFSKDESCANYLTEFINESLPVEFVKSFDWILVSVFSDQNYPLSEIILRHCKTHGMPKWWLVVRVSLTSQIFCCKTNLWINVFVVKEKLP